MPERVERVAAIYDIHGNLPALQAVLAEIEREQIDLIIVGGDVAAGPMPVEVIAVLQSLGERARFVRGNADRMMVSAYDTLRSTPGAPASVEWAVTQLSESDRDFLASFDENVVLDIGELGLVRFCHGSPRGDEEILTALTSEQRLEPILAGVDEAIVVCGHTHIQFDRSSRGQRVLNAGSVGMPYEVPPGARWLRLGPEIRHRTTPFDIDAAARTLETSGHPDISGWIEAYLRNPTPAAEASAYFEKMAIERDAEDSRNRA
jgi:putative phosphoesterase